MLKSSFVINYVCFYSDVLVLISGIHTQDIL